MSDSPPPPKRRVRSEAQLSQKRIADRAKHRENRHENKQRMERMESDIAQIKESLQAITAQLHALPPTISNPAPVHGHPYGQYVGLPGNNMHISNAMPFNIDATRQIAAGNSMPFPGYPSSSSSSSSPGFHPQSLDMGCTSGMPSLPPGQAQSLLSPLSTPHMLNCRCGAQHSDQFDCMDTCNITSLYQAYLTPSQDSSLESDLPRNPSLPTMMLHSQDDNNPIAFFLTPFLRSCKAPSIETLLGCYLFAYRLMRWRMNPNPDTLRDVPPWLLPTQTQTTHPHPICVDYLPWPKLRDYLCTQWEADSRHSINFYFGSIRLDWPPGNPLFSKDEEGQIAISREFESIMSDLRNWRLGPPWSEAFPHLMHLTQS